MMKRLMLCVGLLLSLNLFSQETGIQFEHDLSFEQVLEKAKKDNKFIFVDCYTEWCGPCKKLSADVFPNEEAGKYFNANFINAKIDMEKGEGPKIGKEYKVSGFPTLLILNSDGDILVKKVGYINVTQLLSMGSSAISNPVPLSAIKKKINEGDRSEVVVLKYLDANFSYRKPKEYSKLLDEYFEKLTEEQKYSQSAWDVFNAYQFDVYSEQFVYFVEHRSKFEETFGQEATKEKISQIFSMNSHGLEPDSQEIKDLRNIDEELFESHLLISAVYESLNECQKKKDSQEAWDNFINKLSVYAADENASIETLNNLCWLIYENRNALGEENLAKAKKCSFKTVQADSKSHLYNDTYAHLCFEVGEVKEAIKYQEIAIECATRDKADATWYGEEVERYKKAL